jgi:hypothetical protein
MLILTVHKPLPPLPRVTPKNIGEPGVQLYLVFVKILVQFLSSQDLGYPHKLVVVVVPMEERLFSKIIE